MSKRLPTNTEEARRQAFETALVDQHKMAIRTADALRKIVLIPTQGEQQTELDDFKQGQVDPQIQLVLIARNEYLQCENPVARLGFYKTMKDVFQDVDNRTMRVLDMAMKERHHREKLELAATKLNAEPTDAELDAMIESDA